MVSLFFFPFSFHPLLISAYVIAFLIYIHPSVFEGVDNHTANLRMLECSAVYFIFPGAQFVSGLAVETGQKSHSGEPKRQADWLLSLPCSFISGPGYVCAENLHSTPPVCGFISSWAVFWLYVAAWMCTIFL